MKKHSMKSKATDSSEVCEDCGQEECCCEEACGCEGGACGSCGPSSCCGSCGSSGYGGWHDGHGMHKKWLGIGLILLGILWYLKNTNVIPAPYFWPIVFVVAGLGLIGKSYMMRHG